MLSDFSTHWGQRSHSLYSRHVQLDKYSKLDDRAARTTTPVEGLEAGRTETILAEKDDDDVKVLQL